MQKTLVYNVFSGQTCGKAAITHWNITHTYLYIRLLFYKLANIRFLVDIIANPLDRMVILVLECSSENRIYSINDSTLERKHSFEPLK